jgi:hypothetical protein
MMDFQRITRLGWPVSVAALVLAIGWPPSDGVEAVSEPMYTLPFYDSYTIPEQGCFGCYPGHEGTDYVIGSSGPGESVAAGAGGLAKPCEYSASAGNYIVVDHGAGHRTRYLHLNSQPLPGNGQPVGRGQTIGFEGSTGYVDPPGFNHLHFETRINATTFTCGKDGTAVDPYGSSPYLWSTGPPSYYQGTETAGVFRWPPLEWRLADEHGEPGDPPPTHHYSNSWGQAGDKAVYGDWDGDGKGSIALFRKKEGSGTQGRWRFSNTVDPPATQGTLVYGEYTDTPVAGDWESTGVSYPGLYRAIGNNGWWYINYEFDPWTNITPFKYGLATDLPVSGDWDCDGDETIGVYRIVAGEGYWYLNDGLDIHTDYWPPLEYGTDGDVAVAGDWDGDGCDSIGLFRPSNGTWYLNNQIDDDDSNYVFPYGVSTDQPVVGDWDGQ